MNIEFGACPKKWHPPNPPTTRVFALMGEMQSHCRGKDGSLDALGWGVIGDDRPLISVIAPTSFARHGFHPLLYECFCKQDRLHSQRQTNHLFLAPELPTQDLFFKA